jgi:hypothetical protein
MTDGSENKLSLNVQATGIGSHYWSIDIVPKNMNDHPSNPDISSSEYELFTKLLTEFRQVWLDHLKESGADPVKFSQLSVLALSQFAAIVAVDINMHPKQFEAVCNANFKTAHDKAPKFS